jgi:hypothetical protein
MRKLAVSLSLLLLVSGCFQIDNAINLKQDLSGTADFHLGIDLEPMVVVMAQMGKSMSGKTGPLTPEELAAAKADFKKSEKKSDEGPKPTVADMQKSMPEGIKLLDFQAIEKEFGVDTNFKFAFDKLSHLTNVKLPGAKNDDPTKKTIVDTPFDGLETVEKGDTITIRTRPINPTEKVKEEASGGPKLDADTEKMVKDALSKLRVTYRITAPFKIVSHNATRQEGQTLVWEYDMAKLEEMGKAKNLDDAGVRVTYKR